MKVNTFWYSSEQGISFAENYPAGCDGSILECSVTYPTKHGSGFQIGVPTPKGSRLKIVGVAHKDGGRWEEISNIFSDLHLRVY